MMWEKIKSILRSVGTWIKIRWKWIIRIILGILGLFIGISIWKKIEVVFGHIPKDSSKARWMKLDGDKRAIAVQVPGTTEVKAITLPEGYISDNVVAVGYDAKKYILTVEVGHGQVDRRNTKPTPNSAYDVLSGSANTKSPD